MKKICAVLIIVFVSSSTFAQFVQNYGFKAGYVSSKQDYDNSAVDDIVEWKSGLSVTVFVDLFDLSSFSISTELKYIQKGWGAEFIITGPEGPEPIDKKYFYIYHNYLSIPISLKYKFDFDIGKPFIKIAPRYDILLKSYDDFEGPPTEYDEYENVFGGTISLGFIPYLEIGFNPFIEASYHWDFTNTYEGSVINIKNRAFEIELGILL